MCGIAGIMTLSGSAPDDAVLKALQDALAHRGPDGRGRHISGATGLVQTRLAIIDLETGDQPLYAPHDGQKIALVANGEIYNYVELKLDMGRVDFQTQSDCEPPLHLYLRHGLDFARHLLRELEDLRRAVLRSADDAERKAVGGVVVHAIIGGAVEKERAVSGG